MMVMVTMMLMMVMVIMLVTAIKKLIIASVVYVASCSAMVALSRILCRVHSARCRCDASTGDASFTHNTTEEVDTVSSP